MPVAQITPSNILVARAGPVVRLTINKPPLNILDLTSLREMRTSLQSSLEDGGVRIVELSGAGEKAFCAGTDIHEHVPEFAPDLLREFHGLIREVLNARCPTLAVVRGHCLGGGMELAIACDFIIASSDAQFGLPEIKVGAFPPVGAILLPKIIPEKKALEIILTGEPISSEEALKLGLINRVVAESSFEGEANAFSATLLAQSPCTLALARKATRLASRNAFEAELREAERIYLEELLPTKDANEGVRAFMEKRQPIWKS